MINAEWGKHYLIEISLYSGNTKHKGIGMYKDYGYWYIWNGTYETPTTISEKNVNHFTIIQELDI